MPELNLPMAKGTGVTDDEFDWVDVFPINLIVNAEPVLNGNGFMRPWVGLESFFVETSAAQPIGCTGARFVNTRMGISMGSEGIESLPESQFRAMGNTIYRGYRMQGSTNQESYFSPLISLFREGDMTGSTVTSNPFIRMSNSFNYFVFIYGGRLYYFSPRIFLGEMQPTPPLAIGSALTNTSPNFNVLKDWAESEYIPARMEGGMVWIPRLRGGNDRISFNIGARSRISLSEIRVSINIGGTNIDETLTEKLWIFSNQVPEMSRVGIFLDPDDKMFYVKLNAPDDPLQLTFNNGKSVVTLGHVEYSLEFPQGVSNNVPEAVNAIAYGATFSKDLFIDSLHVNTEAAARGILGFVDGSGMFIFRSSSISSPPNGNIINMELDRGRVRDQTIVTVGANWERIELVSTSTPLPRSNYNGKDNDDLIFTDILDVDFHGGRFVFLRQQDSRFYSTSLVSPANGSGEQRPDYQSAEQDARNEGGGFPTAIRAWHNYVVVFSPHTTQYFHLTGNAEQLYRRLDSLTIDCGTMSTRTVCEFRDSFVVVGSPVNERLSVYLLSQGQYHELANRTVQQILRKEGLRNLLIEPIKFDNHDGFIIHLENMTLFYNDSLPAAPWSILSSSTDGESPYVGVHHVFDENQQEWHCGVRSFESTTAYIMRFNHEIATHAIAAAPSTMTPIPMPENRAVLYQVTTAIAQVRNVRIHDVEIDIIYNQPDQNNDAITIAKTTDGINFIEPYNMLTDNPNVGIDQRLLLRNYGYSENNIGFMISWNNIRNPITISNFRIRVEK